MDPISPDLQWIEGRCYRVNDRQEFRQEEYTEYDEGDDLTMEAEGDDDDGDVEYVTCPNGRVTTSLPIAQSFHGVIIGARGATLKRLMNETCTNIKVPPRHSNGNVTISGPDRKKVAAAVRRIQMIVFSSRQKQSPTHFLSLPVNSKQITENFIKFKEDVLSNYCDHGIDESIFTEPTKLHLTLTVLSLMDLSEIEAGSKLLQQAKEKIIDPLLKQEPIEVSIKGTTIMNDDPSKTNILYAKIEETDKAKNGILLELFQDLTNFFSHNGFESSRQHLQNKKLHVTLMKSNNRSNEGEEKAYTKRIPFDATRILDKYNDFCFGNHTIKEIHLSQMGTIDSDGYYKSSVVVNL